MREALFVAGMLVIATGYDPTLPRDDRFISATVRVCALMLWVLIFCDFE